MILVRSKRHRTSLVTDFTCFQSDRENKGPERVVYGLCAAHKLLLDVEGTRSTPVYSIAQDTNATVCNATKTTITRSPSTPLRL